MQTVKITYLRSFFGITKRRRDIVIGVLTHLEARKYFITFIHFLFYIILGACHTCVLGGSGRNGSCCDLAGSKIVLKACSNRTHQNA